MDEILTQKEVAKLLRTNPQSITLLSKARGLPTHYYARTPRYVKSEVIEWMKKQPSTKQDRLREQK